MLHILPPLMHMSEHITANNKPQTTLVDKKMEISAYTLLSSKIAPTPTQASSTANFISPLCFNYSGLHLHKYHAVTRNNKNFAKKAQITKIDTKLKRGYGVSAVRAEGVGAEDAERWLLEPIGDGDWRHIGSEVAMPGPFEIASKTVIVGRVPERANLVIPVATVSGVHARIQKKGRSLLVTDLDSTNGTFIGERRLKPGVTIRISSGSSVTFGDTHLAMFRVSRLENTESNESEAELESEALEKSEAISENLEPIVISETS